MAVRELISWPIRTEMCVPAGMVYAKLVTMRRAETMTVFRAFPSMISPSMCFQGEMRLVVRVF